MTIDQELEAKFYLQGLESMKEKLTTLGAVLTQPRTFEVNLRFDTENEDLAENHQLLRLRRDQGVRLTFKGPMKNYRGATLRQEIEVEVGDYEATRRLLEALGYQVTRIYEKYRTTYHLGTLEITLDEMPFGNFVEIEGEDVAKIRQAAHDLGLDWSANISANYLMLFDAVCSRLGLQFRDLTFENFSGLVVSVEDLNVRPADGGR